LKVSYLLKPYFLSPNKDWSDTSTIVEIIGDIGYLFNFPNVPFLVDGGPFPKGLRCYSDSSFGSFETGVVDSCNHYGNYVGVESIKLFDSKIYPNPAHDILNIEITPSTHQHEFVFELYDVLGKRVLVQSLQPYQNTVNVSGLSAGVYSYRIGEVWGHVVIE
jgi:hypothetical protein